MIQKQITIYGATIYKALTILFLAGFVTVLSPPQTARASCACAGIINAQAQTASLDVTQDFIQTKNWLVDGFFGQLIAPLLGNVTTQLSAVGFAQTTMIGTFFDAEQQLNRQLALDKAHIRAVKDYQPSTALCKFGTATLALASSEHRAQINHRLFMKHALDRQLGAKGTLAESANNDLNQRIRQFGKIYCDPQDNNGFLAGNENDVCGVAGGIPARYNKDINFTRTLDAPLTLDINLTDTTTSADEEDIFALGSNLFGYSLLPRLTASKLRDNIEEYHAARSAVAKRSVAENSFYALAAEKAKGTGANSQYLRQMVSLLGFKDDPNNADSDVARLIGDNPSYYAQMEILTKKIYQDPGFVVSLVDKPANVERQKAAMQSFRLMQQRDFYNSLIRQEMVLSLILEELLYEKTQNLQ